MRAAPRAVLLLLGGAITSVAFARATPGAAAPEASAPTAAEGQRVMEGAGCALCHTIPEVPAPGRLDGCVACHDWVHAVSANPRARAAALEAFPLWERYERSVRSYADVPDLAAAAARLEPSWWAGFLADPHDLRPAMPEGMVRVGLDAAARDAITAWATAHHAPAPASPAPAATRVSEGERLFDTRGCAACHTFGAARPGPGIPTAPDLRHARDRMSDDAIVAWILDPAAVSPAATMPAMGLTRDEAVAVRDYLVLADPGGAIPPTPPTLPRHVGEVRWAEVEERVFGRICVHCHMEPSLNDGRRGPGNAGGFGFAPTGIELQTVDGVRAHAPAIVAALLRRREEAARDTVAPGEAPQAIVRPAMPGMPLGLPPIPDDDVARVIAWVEQGMPE